jgi:pimeloyl-ACP methyl ester carboxylesterase
VVDFDDLIRAGIVARRAGPPPAADLLEAMVAKVRDRIGPYGWLRFFDLFTETPFLDLSRVDVPCLVVGGGLDTASYPADSAGLAAALPDARLEILPGCGHFGLVDNPVPAAAMVLDFLDGLGLTAVPPIKAAVPHDDVRPGGRDPQPAT